MKITLFIFVMLLAVLVVYFSINLFEEDHNIKLKGITQHVKGYHPETTFTFSLYPRRVNSDLINYMQEMAQKHDASLIVARNLYDEADPRSIIGNAPPQIHFFIYSKDPEFIPPTFLSQKSTDWSEQASREFLW